MGSRQLIYAGFVAPLLVGCSVPTPPSSVVPQPSQIRLEDAMQSVGQGLVDMNRAAHSGGNTKPFGLSAQEVTITFNVTAAQSGTNSGKLVIDLNAAPPAISAGLGLKVGGEAGSTQVLQTARGNTIVVKFLNPIFAPKDTLVFSTATTKPSNLKETLKIISQAQTPAAK